MGLSRKIIRQLSIRRTNGEYRHATPTDSALRQRRVQASQIIYYVQYTIQKNEFVSVLAGRASPVLHISHPRPGLCRVSSSRRRFTVCASRARKAPVTIHFNRGGLTLCHVNSDCWPLSSPVRSSFPVLPRQHLHHRKGSKRG
jgi:hypothetical protein